MAAPQVKVVGLQVFGRRSLDPFPLFGCERRLESGGYPLCDVGAIGERQARVAVLAESDRARGRLREALAGVRDLERRFARCERPGAEPRDLAALRSSLAALPAVRDAATVRDEMLTEAAVSLPQPEAPLGLTQLLVDALVDDPRPLPRGSRGANETGYVRPGFRPELDALRDSARKVWVWPATLTATERASRSTPAGTRCATPSDSETRWVPSPRGGSVTVIS